jgi:hypothetical protein
VYVKLFAQEGNSDKLRAGCALHKQLAFDAQSEISLLV